MQLTGVTLSASNEDFPAILRRTNHANGGGDLEHSVTLFRLDDQGPIAHEGRSSRVTLSRFPSFHCTACNVFLDYNFESDLGLLARHATRVGPHNPPREFSQPAIAIRFRSRFSDDPAIHSAHRPIGYIEYLHDVCLVRPTEVYRQAALARHHRKLEHCACRILLCRSSEPVRPCRLFDGAIENDAGSDNAYGVRAILGRVS